MLNSAADQFLGTILDYVVSKIPFLAFARERGLRGLTFQRCEVVENKEEDGIRIVSVQSMEDLDDVIDQFEVPLPEDIESIEKGGVVVVGTDIQGDPFIHSVDQGSKVSYKFRVNGGDDYQKVAGVGHGAEGGLLKIVGTSIVLKVKGGTVAITVSSAGPGNPCTLAAVPSGLEVETDDDGNYILESEIVDGFENLEASNG